MIKEVAKIVSLRALIMVGSRGISSLETSEVVENLKKGKVENTGTEFRVHLGQSHYAKVFYEKNGEHYDLQHAVIPDEYQGKGLGSILAEKILEHLITENKSVKIKLTCEYLQHFFKKNEVKYKNYIEELN